MISESERLIYNILLFGKDIPDSQLEMISISTIEKFKDAIDSYVATKINEKIKVCQKI